MKNFLRLSPIFLAVLFIFSCDEPGNNFGAFAVDDGIVDTVINGMTLTSNAIGTQGNYGYEFWKDTGNATATMTLGRGGTFKGEWNANGMNNVLMRRGLKFGSTQRHGSIGNISVNYTASWSPQGNGVSYLCVYGWTQNPLIEYYIIDDWGPMNKPPGSWETGREHKGTISVDGGIYDIYTSRSVGPSIEGDNRSFTKYWSVRQTRRTSGTVSVSEHFKKWESLGMRMGGLYEVALTVEGYNSRGTATITKNSLIIKK